MTDSLIWQAHNIIARWREWAEYQTLSAEEFESLVEQSDKLQDVLLDAALKLRATPSA